MNAEYINLIDSEEKIEWAIKQYGQEEFKRMVENVGDEVTELSQTLQKGMNVLLLVQRLCIEINKGE